MHPLVFPITPNEIRLLNKLLQLLLLHSIYEVSSQSKRRNRRPALHMLHKVSLDPLSGGLAIAQSFRNDGREHVAAICCAQNL